MSCNLQMSSFLYNEQILTFADTISEYNMKAANKFQVIFIFPRIIWLFCILLPFQSKKQAIQKTRIECLQYKIGTTLCDIFVVNTTTVCLIGFVCVWNSIHDMPHYLSNRSKFQYVQYVSIFYNVQCICILIEYTLLCHHYNTHVVIVLYFVTHSGAKYLSIPIL